jgi:putative ABC transport system substrate-binding protein
MMNVANPVGDGFVKDLARPGGNITGFTNFAPTLSGKRLEYLKETVPEASRIALLWNPVALQAINSPEVIVTEEMARRLTVQLQSVEARTVSDLEPAFSKMTAGRVDAVVVLADGLFNANRTRIVDLASASRIPAIYVEEEYVDAGGLMSYGPSIKVLARWTASYVDKILKGSKPADLPVQRPKEFEFVINLKAAKQIAFPIPPHVLARANRVIK